MSLSTPRPGTEVRDASTDGWVGNALRLIEEGTAAGTGERFLRLMVRQLAAATGARWAFVSELADPSEHRVRLFAFWSGLAHEEPFEYDVRATPCEQVFAAGEAVYPRGVQAAFPQDRWLREIGAESYMAVALYASDDTPLGHLGVLHDQPLDESMPLLSVLRIFRSRAAAELERTRRERDLRQSEERYRRLVESSTDIMFRLRVGETFRFEYVNPAVLSILGITPEEFYDNPRLLIELADDDEERREVQDILSGQRFYESRLRRWRRKDGAIVWTEQRNIPVYDEQGKLVAMEGVARDVTALVELQDSVKEREDVQRKVLQALPEQVLRIDRRGTILSVIATGWTGTSGAGVGKKLRDLVPRKNARDLGQAMLAAQDSGRVHGVAYAKEVDGQERHFEMRIVPGTEADSYCILRDVTADVWLKAETELRSQQDELEGKVEREMSARDVYGLTFRELSILHLVAQGETDRAIATKLGLSLFTVNKHVSNILGKMGVASRTEASVRAASERLIS